MQIFRILSLDGGGIKGAFTASFLASMERYLTKPIGAYFDLIAGTSTGGIIALGLGLGLKAEQLAEFYRKLGPLVFRGGRFTGILKQIGVSKYSNKPLKKALEETFGDRRLGESTTRLVVPSLDLETGKVHVFKTAHHERLQTDYKVKVVEVALATAAAPTYFPTYRLSSGTPLVDGGVWANNPAGVAVVEAIGLLRWPRDQVRVLSIGGPSPPLDVGIGRRFALGRFYWAQKVTEVFLSGQSSGSLGTASLLIGHEYIHRICPPAPPGRFSLDCVNEIQSLFGLGESEARSALPTLKDVFFQGPAEPFNPIRSLPAASE